MDTERITNNTNSSQTIEARLEILDSRTKDLQKRIKDLENCEEFSIDFTDYFQVYPIFIRPGTNQLITKYMLPIRAYASKSGLNLLVNMVIF